MPSTSTRRLLVSARVGLAAALLAAGSATAGPLEYISPRHPLAVELRVLELYDQPADTGRFRLPHFNTWPLRRLELMGEGPAGGSGNLSRDIVTERVEREIQRDATAEFADERARRSTPRVWERRSADERVELSVGLEGEYAWARLDGVDESGWRDASGLHVRGALQQRGWLAFAHLTAGQLRDADRYTDVLASGTDLALQTDEAYLSAHGDTRWTAAMGRQRFGWGPGEEGSLLLSRTAAPLNALWLHAHVRALRGDLFSVNATTDPGLGEQLAAHRLEWAPANGLRIGVAEAARYQADGWLAVYVASVIPYSLAQRLLQQDGDTAGVNRNNVLFSTDVSWRIADGTRIYGEVLLDDIHAETAEVPNKFAWQLGLDGVWTRGFARLTWNAEYTWLSRFVYTSFFGRSFTAQALPLGYPTGPDSRRLHTRFTLDPRVDWQVTGLISRTWKGENGLDEPYVPGTPVPPVNVLEGVPTVTDVVTGIVRWWPASGVDLSLALGWSRTEDAGHVAGATLNGAHASLALRLVR